MNSNSVIAEIAFACHQFNEEKEKTGGFNSYASDLAKKRVLFYEQHLLPHGSGIDSGCSVLISKSGLNKVVIRVPHHDMDENGHYCGWSYYTVTATVNFLGLRVKVTGGRKQDRDYIAEILQNAMEYVPTGEERTAAHRSVYSMN